MEIWPAIDIRGGRCVRLVEGDFNRETVFDADPVAVAARFVEQGARRIHVVDLDGAREGKPVNRDLVLRIAAESGLAIELGGGIRDRRTLADYLAGGLARVVVGTRAVEEPEWLAEVAHRHPGRVVLGLDARNGRLASRGWLATTARDVLQYAIQLGDLPLAAVVYTDIARDGVMKGPNIEATRRLAEAIGVPVVASGGVSQLSDVEALARLPIAGMIIGRALYEGTIDLASAIEVAGDR
ncbi:MAG: 1-(5-phosphoribosyl)-5-[(5-phosphoribosylamino)methylideneamino]imidazole-4-carboxamide isomerase [Anaerolineaceae bacterium]|nr:1-(5-phosphoribosyl)-5-[(5-phosphoribosylamino)methylideneamino]imidazole-4-carboxamide isomerase [Anaerolineaceae bacterium]